MSKNRRSKLRVVVDFPAIVRGVDQHNQRFEEQTKLQDLSADGLCVKLQQTVQPGTKLLIAFRLASTLEAPALSIAAQALVRHAPPQPCVSGGVGVIFQRYRFLYQAERSP